MSTIHVHRTTNVTPEQYVAVLTDFGPGRSQIFGNSSDDYLKVHHRGVSQADVTEGSGGIWERLHYDWSDPNRVVLTTIDSNVWGGASGHTYTFTRQSNGTTGIDVAVIRDGKNLMGRLLGFVLGQSASTFWRRHSKSPSRPSKSGTRSSNTCAQAAQALPTSPLKRLCGSDVMEVLQEQPPAAGLAESWPYFDFWGKHGPVNLASTSSNRGWSGLSAQLCSVGKAVFPWRTPQSEIRICVNVRGNKSFIARRAPGIESRIVVRRGTVWLSPPGLQEGSLDITEDMSGVLHIYLPLRHFSPGNLDINIDRSAVGVLVERSIAAGYSACWIILKRTLKAILPLISWHPLLA